MEGYDNQTSRQRNNGIKRNPISFFIFLSKQRKKLRLDNPHGNLDNKVISKTMSLKWKSMTDEDKRVYVEAAKCAKEDHQATHPEYRFAPNRKLAQLGTRSTGCGYCRKNGSTKSLSHCVKDEFQQGLKRQRSKRRAGPTPTRDVADVPLVNHVPCPRPAPAAPAHPGNSVEASETTSKIEPYLDWFNDPCYPSVDTMEMKSYQIPELIPHELEPVPWHVDGEPLKPAFNPYIGDPYPLVNSQMVSMKAVLEDHDSNSLLGDPNLSNWAPM